MLLLIPICIRLHSVRHACKRRPEPRLSTRARGAARGWHTLPSPAARHTLTLVLLNIRSDADWTRSIMADTAMAVVAIYGITAASH